MKKRSVVATSMVATFVLGCAAVYANTAASNANGPVVITTGQATVLHRVTSTVTSSNQVGSRVSALPQITVGQGYALAQTGTTQTNRTNGNTNSDEGNAKANSKDTENIQHDAADKEHDAEHNVAKDEEKDKAKVKVLAAAEHKQAAELKQLEEKRSDKQKHHRDHHAKEKHLKHEGD